MTNYILNGIINIILVILNKITIFNNNFIFIILKILDQHKLGYYYSDNQISFVYQDLQLFSLQIK